MQTLLETPANFYNIIIKDNMNLCKRTCPASQIAIFVTVPPVKRNLHERFHTVIKLAS